jgi:hypothetical protein
LVSNSSVSSTTGLYTISFDLYGNYGQSNQYGFFFGTSPPRGVHWIISDTAYESDTLISDSKGSWEKVSYPFNDGSVLLVFEDWSGAQYSGASAYYLRNEVLTDNSNNSEVGSLSVTAIPESSSWALMLMGFAAIGFAAYRHSKNERAYALS